jgi:hypothetical protein
MKACLGLLILLTAFAVAQDQPRVFIASAESKGSNWGTLRNQNIELTKDFQKDCPGVRVTVNQDKADYTVTLNHVEHGLVRDNQVEISNRMATCLGRPIRAASRATQKAFAP